MITMWQRASLGGVVLASLLWFATTLGRLLVTYDLYQPGTSTLRPLPIEHRLDQLRLAENIATLAWASYGALLVATVAMALSWRGHLRHHGYITITILLVMASLLWQLWIVPSELALLAEFPSRWIPPVSDRSTTILQIVTKRVFQQSVADLLSLLTGATILIVLSLQPRRLENA